MTQDLDLSSLPALTSSSCSATIRREGDTEEQVLQVDVGGVVWRRGGASRHVSSQVKLSSSSSSRVSVKEQRLADA